jgi:uncharacterized protein (TIGR02284 family)
MSGQIKLTAVNKEIVMKSTVDHELQSHVQELIRLARDGELGFQSAGDSLEAGDLLRDELFSFSAQRGEFKRELESAALALGFEPASSGSIAGAAHRGWMSVRNAVSTTDRTAILAECERGEELAARKFAEASLLALPPTIAEIVRRQSRAIESTYERIRSLHANESVASR